MRLGIIGGGAWGTALAQVAASGGEEVLLWAREGEVVDAVNARHENPLYLPGRILADGVRATGRLSDMEICDALLIVTPAQHVRAVVGALPAGPRPLVLCAKGIEADTGLLMSHVVADVRPDAPVAVLSGPTFAHEVAAGLPTAVTLACGDADLGGRLAARLARPWFRPYLSDDVVGAEIGGAVKNVLAIACGVADGAGLGLNARAALISRGFAEMSRFGLAMGARAETLSGLSGLGDLVLTCSSDDSRNFTLGRGLGQGRAPADLLAARRTVAEGAFTAPVLSARAQAMGVDMPLCEAVCALVSGQMQVNEAVAALLARPLRAE